MAEQVPPSSPSPAVKRGLFWAIDRRLRARILRKEKTGPLTFADWLRDLGKVIALLVSLGVFIVILTTGTPLYRALSLALFGYRPIGTLDDSLVLGFFVVALPVSFIGFGVCMVIIMWTYRSNSIGSHIIISTALVCTAFFPFYWYFLGPQVNKHQHLNNWPAQLELASFNVCGVEVNEEPTRTVAPVGRITVDLVNRSDVAITGAVFTTKVGSNWYHISVTDLPAKAKRRVEVERDLGIIEIELSGDMSGWAQRNGEIYWDHVRPRDVMEQKLIRRPEIAEVFPIGDCPRNDISGVWKGADSAELTLSQRGIFPRGYVKGGSLQGSYNELSGAFDGKSFSGAIQQHAGRVVFSGTFKLVLTPDRRLRGTWVMASQKGKQRTGEWTFSRTGPGPPAPRRR